MRRFILIGAVAPLLLIAGCAGPAEAIPTVSMPVADVNCEQARDGNSVRAAEVIALQGATAVADWLPNSARPSLPSNSRESLSTDFEPIAAIRCLERWDTNDGFLGYSQQLFTTDMGQLVEHLSNNGPVLNPEGCQQWYDPQPNIWLLDESGNAIAPAWPIDSCEHLIGPTPEELLPLDLSTSEVEES